MVYDWAHYRDVCFQMYITERKALEEIMQYMRDVYQFAPSKRAFQTQFKRWGFPSKQNPAHRNADLVNRVKELWEKNTSQRDMLKTLNEEGFGIKERELMRVRAKNRWLLRVPNGMKSQGATEATLPTPQDHGNEDLSALHQGMLEAATTFDDAPDLSTDPVRATSPSLSPEVIAKRKERYKRLQAESEQRWAARKRRRRTRGWAGLPADPPGPPRFPSETTIEESKQYLSLDGQMYHQLRDHFQKICEEGGVIKKTLAGPEKWQAAKDRLISESLHLQAVFWTNNTQHETKQLALDVICTDVTKRIRTLERRMTIAEAKNILGVNPEESRQVRNAFYNTLKADHFTSKLEAGDEHWKELKDRWIQQSPLLQSILVPGAGEPEHETKLKAMEVLCRDVMKRLRDDQTKRDPTRKQLSKESTTNDLVDSNEIGMGGEVSQTSSMHTSNEISQGISSLASRALASDITDMQIDPSLLQAANDPTFAADHSSDGQSYLPHLLDLPSAAPVAVYVRPHHKSQLYRTTKMWLGSLSARSVSELRNLLGAKWPNALITRIDGVEKGVNGEDISYLIEDDEELDAYLTHVQDRKATFVAHLSCP